MASLAEQKQTQHNVLQGSPEFIASPAEIALSELTRAAAVCDNPADKAQVEAGVEAQRQELWKVVRHGIAVRPQATEILMQYGQLLEYAWLGARGDQPPNTIVRDERRGMLRIDPEAVDEVGLSQAHKFLGVNGMHRLAVERGKHLKNNYPLVKAAIREAITETPGFQAFTAFDFEMPQPTERPLNRAEKASREAEMHKQTAGMPAPIARRHIAQATARLEQETRHAGYNVPASGGLAAAKAFITQRAKEVGPDEPNDIIKRGHAITAIDEQMYDFYDLHKAFGDLAYGSTLGDDMLRKLVEKVVLAKDDTVTYGERLDQFLDAEAGQLFANMKDSLWGDSEIVHLIQLFKDPAGPVPVKLVQNRFSAKLTGLEGVNKPDTPTDQFDTAESIDSETVSYTTAEDYEHQKQQVIGRVVRAKRGGTTPRIMIEANESVHDLDGFSLRSVDLAVARTDRTGRAHRIPGYELVGYNDADNTYGYKREARDVYEACGTVLTEAQQAEAIAIATTAGVSGLAADIARHKDLTVTGMINLIRSHSRYYLPRQGDPDAGAVFPQPQSAEDLKVFADGSGVFMVQCDSVAAVCRIFLEGTGLGRVGAVTAGTMLQARKGAKLTGMLHEQLPYIDAKTGKLYMLDATPPREEARHYKLSQLAQLTGRSLLGATAEAKNKAKDVFAKLMAPLVIKKTVQVEARPLSPEERRQAALMANRNQLLNQLGRALGVNGHAMPADLVFKNVAQRPATDLMRLSMEVVENTVPWEGIAAEDEAKSYYRAKYLLEYIDELRTAPEKVRDPHQYRNRRALLSTLEKSLGTVTELTKLPQADK